MDWLSTISLFVSIITGPVVVAAVSAMHRNSTRSIIDAMLKDHAEKTDKAFIEHARQIEKDMQRERERNGEVYALKHEVAEMKGYVMQVVSTLSRVEGKLDDIEKSTREAFSGHRSQ